MREYTLRHDRLHAELSGQLAASFWSALATAFKVADTARSRKETNTTATVTSTWRRRWRALAAPADANCLLSSSLRIVANASTLEVARALQNEAANCPDSSPCSLSCRNVYSLMLIWILYRPAFQLLVILLSSPLALLVALWGMTNKRMLELMNAPRAKATMMT